MRNKRRVNEVTIKDANGNPIQYVAKNYDKLQKDEWAFVLLVIIPQLIVNAIFYIYTNLSSFTMAFQLPTGEWSTFTMTEAFKTLINPESDIAVGFRNTLIFFVVGLGMMFFSLGLTYFFYRKIKMTKFFQLMLFLPGMISGVATVAMFSNLIMPEGPIGVLYESLTGNRLPPLLADSRYAVWTILFYVVWSGWAGEMLLYGGTLARIPVEVLESARLDGISSWGELWKILFPMIWNTFSTILILSCTGFLYAGGPILLFTKGRFGTYTISYWMFDRVLNNDGGGTFNEVAAMGLYLTIIQAPIIIGIRKLVEKVPAVEY